MSRLVRPSTPGNVTIRVFRCRRLTPDNDRLPTQRQRVFLDLPSVLQTP
ncbi:MAG: hypothetical protein O3B13_07235 [Planctomycetota bacterium]|nr:hypothetical protein [Planctomycetota bacterium]